tara:strand:- start:139 stop:498 length:360 start_codon:yes stop_codon:yes gene_type:complete
VYKQNNNFEYDLKFGQMKEKELADILENQKIEVKTDCKWKKTGNLAIEYKSRGKPSGISTTKAEYWAFILDSNGYAEGILIVPIAKLLIISKYHYQLGNIINGGENSDMVLVPIADLVK